MLVITLGACKGKEEESQITASDSSSVSTKTESTQAPSSQTEQEDVSTISGTISEIKDFAFTLETDDGNAYMLTFENPPEGLDQVKENDSVTVKYSGELSEIDPFKGEVISVEKN